MQRSADPGVIELLDRWYQTRCNGEWEHRYGVTLRTCDNPGWWLTIDDPQLSSAGVPEPIVARLARDGVQFHCEGTQMHLFAVSLEVCLAGLQQILLSNP